MRSISIANHHPRLRINRRSVARAMAILDDRFRFTAADLPFLDPTGRRHAREQASSVRRKLPVSSPLPPGELSLVFLTDEALAELHARFLDDPNTTDVITFNGLPETDTAGEICVSVDTAVRYAQARKGAFSEELTLYLVHGWLHLAGYDDLEPKKKRRMRTAETRAMTLLQKTAALPVFSL